MFWSSHAVVQQQEKDHRPSEVVLRRIAARCDMLAGDTGGQQSEHGLLPRNKYRQHRLDRGTLEADCLCCSVHERPWMARSNEQVILLAFLPSVREILSIDRRTRW